MSYQDITNIYCDYFTLWYKIYHPSPNAFHYDLYYNFYKDIHLEIEPLIKYSAFSYLNKSNDNEKWYNCIFNLFKQFEEKLIEETNNNLNIYNAEYFISTAKLYAYLEYLLRTKHLFFANEYKGIPLWFNEKIKQYYFNAFDYINELNDLYGAQTDDYIPVSDELEDNELIADKCFNDYMDVLSNFIKTYEMYYDSSLQIQNWYKQLKNKKMMFNKIVAFNQLNKFSNLNLDTIQTILLKV